jgi:hypothetical protein
MASTADPASPGIWKKGEHEVSAGRLYLLRATALIFVVSGCFSIPRMFIGAHPTDRGMIDAFLGGLWVMSFLALRYPLQMLPIFLFEFVWKTIWLLAFGLPQWLSGIGSPRLNRDMLEIGSIPILIALVIPWPHVWRRYVRQPAERWR